MIKPHTLACVVFVIDRRGSDGKEDAEEDDLDEEDGDDEDDNGEEEEEVSNSSSELEELILILMSLLDDGRIVGDFRTTRSGIDVRLFPPFDTSTFFQKMPSINKIFHQNN